MLILSGHRFAGGRVVRLMQGDYARRPSTPTIRACWRAVCRGGCSLAACGRSGCGTLRIRQPNCDIRRLSPRRLAAAGRRWRARRSRCRAAVRCRRRTCRGRQPCGPRSGAGRGWLEQFGAERLTIALDHASVTTAGCCPVPAGRGRNATLDELIRGMRRRRAPLFAPISIATAC